MRMYDDNSLTAGNTPLVRLNRVAGRKATVFAKIEGRNPAYSVKDRLGAALIRDANLSDTTCTEKTAPVVFKRVMLEDGSLDFSFSGLKTGVLNYINSERQAGRPVSEAAVATGFQDAVIDVLAAKTQMTLKQAGRQSLVLAGGVAANSALRARIHKDAEIWGVRLYIPSPAYCTDNAAMIACAGYYQYLAGGVDGLSLDAHATLPL